MDHEKIVSLTKDLNSIAAKFFSENSQISSIIESFPAAGGVVMGIELVVDILPIEELKSAEVTQFEAEYEIKKEEEDDAKPSSFYEC